jgi:hypothetical protein
MSNRHIIVAFAGTAALFVSSAAFAGEVTGQSTPSNRINTAVRDHARSICAFSGLEDGTYLAGIDPNTGAPIFLSTADSGPGYVQTPSHQTSPGIESPPGAAGDSCRGGSWPLP